jgi:hypothetical protein
VKIISFQFSDQRSLLLNPPHLVKEMSLGNLDTVFGGFCGSGHFT